MLGPNIVSGNSVIKLGYGENFEEYDPTQQFIVKLPALRYLPSTPFEEAKKAAREIGQKFGENITLCVSGGLDSEAMALAFLHEGIRFEVAILEFSDGLNSHDILHAKQFCNENGIEYKCINLDIVNFLNTKSYRKYTDAYFAHSPEIAAQIWFLDQIESPFVWAGEAFRAFKYKDEIKIQAYCEFESVFQRYLNRSKKRGVANFHFFNSELALSFFKLSLKRQDDFHDEDHQPEYYRKKFEFYQMAGFPVVVRKDRSSKLHGFERVKHYFDSKSNLQLGYDDLFRSEVKSKFPIWGSSLVEFSKDDKLLKQFLNINTRSSEND